MNMLQEKGIQNVLLVIPGDTLLVAKIQVALLAILANMLQEGVMQTAQIVQLDTHLTKVALNASTARKDFTAILETLAVEAVHLGITHRERVEQNVAFVVPARMPPEKATSNAPPARLVNMRQRKACLPAPIAQLGTYRIKEILPVLNVPKEHLVILDLLPARNAHQATTRLIQQVQDVIHVMLEHIPQMKGAPSVCPAQQDNHQATLTRAASNVLVEHIVYQDTLPADFVLLDIMH